MKSLNISQKLIISLIIISVLPYAIISYINYSAEEQALEQNIFDVLSALAEEKNTHITTVLNFRINQVNEIATSNFMQDVESRNIQNLNFNLNRVKNGIPEFFELSALDANGTVIASTDEKAKNKNFMDEELFRKGKDGLFVDTIKYYNNTIAYLISRPVTNRTTGKFIGVLAVRVLPRFIYDVTHDYTGLGETGETLLVQKRGDEVIFLNPLRHYPDAALNLRFPVNSSMAVPAILSASGDKGTTRALDYRGKEVFAAFTFIPAGNWGVVVKIDSREALIPAVRSKWRYFALGILYLEIVAALAYLIGKKYTDPLKRLSVASKKVAKGNLTVHIEPESSDEIGELAQSFNLMVLKLKELYEEMDLKVKERTEDLHKKNIELGGLIKTNQSISSGLDLSKVLDIAVREAVRIVNVSYCSIVLIEENKDVGIIASEYCPRCDFKPTAGELVNLTDCHHLNQAYGEKRYVLIRDTAKADLSAKEKEMVKSMNMKSILFVPLVLGDRSLGAMHLSNFDTVKEFSDDEINICQTIANQAAIAIENAHLFQELKQHDETLETLIEIDRVVSQSLDLDEIFREALSKTIQVTASDAGAIYLLDKDQNTLKLKTSSGISPDFAGAVSEIKVGEGVSGIAAKTRKPYIVDIDRYPSRSLLPAIENEGFITLAGTPLLAKGKVVGAMNLADRKRRIFSKDDIDVLASIGGQIGVAIENARLYQESKISFEKLQKAYTELESLNKMKTEFLSNISHELKTPLISIRGYSELMFDEKIGPLTPTQKKSLEATIRNTDRLTKLIDSLLFMSVQQMGHPGAGMKLKPQSIGEILSVSMSDMITQAEKKNITLIKDFQDDILIAGDRDRLTEVFINLLDNAIKFTDTGGKITIKAIDEGENIHITVTDTGIGIPEEMIPNLFQRFYQADTSATRKYGGTGLGLYICKNIVDAHKGKIWVESKVGIGTTMHILLPKKG